MEDGDDMALIGSLAGLTADQISAWKEVAGASRGHLGRRRTRAFGRGHLASAADGGRLRTS